MIITKIKGGLGNQLFQYSMGRKLSLLANTELKLDIGASTQTFQKDTAREFKLDMFNIRATIATSEETKKLKYPFGYISKLIRGFKFHILKIYNVDYNPKYLKTKENQYVDGFWQTEKYFKDIRNILLDEICLKKELGDEAKKIAEMIQQQKGSVSLHVRRGDYVTDKAAQTWFGNMVTKEYYTEAVGVIKDKVFDITLFVFSDDITWVRDTMHFEFPVTFVSSPQIIDHEEIILMSKCSHNIIANSSFSWWGAWLNKNEAKVVIAPKQWVADPTVQKDTVPETWIKL